MNLKKAATLALVWLAAWTFLSCLHAHAEIDVVPLQQQLSTGQAGEVFQVFDRALEQDADNPYLLYNRAVAAYAAGRFEEALVDLDRVEDSRSRALSSKARFQKGNAEFRLGLTTRTNDVEATLARWKQSLASFDALVRDQPNYAEAKKNHDFVRKQLIELLMKTAQQNLERGQPTNQPPDRRIASLRSAMEQFHDVNQMDAQNQPAQQGEQQARDLLAQALAEEGTRKTLANQMVMPAPNEPAVMRPDIGQIQEGVNMLEDAKALKPDDANIAQQLDQGRERLANALVLQALIYQSVEPRIPRTDDKLGVLRMAMELAEKALDQRPNHQQAQQVLEQIKQRLAQIHEQQGDQLSQQAQAPNAPLEQQAQQLSQALDHFQQASGLQPQQSQLPMKAEQTQSKLEQALDKLADKLMQQPGEKESLDDQAMRLQGAEQALNELQSLKPSDQTGQKARQVGEQLARVRQMLAARGQQPMPQPGESGQQPMPSQPQNNPQGQPMDAPPKLNTPGARGPYQSPAMNRNLRDY